MSFQTSDIVTRVQQRVRDTGFSASEIKGYINDTLNDIYNEYRLPFMETSQDFIVDINNSDITGGDGLPDNYSQAINLTYTGAGGEALIPYKDYSEVDLLHPDADDLVSNPANSNAQFWYYYGNTIRVYPAPSTAYTVRLRYYKKPTPVVSDDSVPEVPSQFEELLVVGASYRVFQVKDNYDQAGILENKYNELLQKFVVQASVRQTGRPVQMAINKVRVGKTSF